MDEFIIKKKYINSLKKSYSDGVNSAIDVIDDFRKGLISDKQARIIKVKLNKLFRK